MNSAGDWLTKVPFSTNFNGTYFPNLYNNEEHKTARNSKHPPEPMQEQATDLKHDSAAKGDFENLEISSFWIKHYRILAIL